MFRGCFQGRGASIKPSWCRETLVSRTAARLVGVFFSVGRYTAYTQRNLSEILVNQTEIRLYLPFPNWFGTANRRPFAVQNQSVHGKYNLISIWFNNISERFLCVQRPDFRAENSVRNFLIFGRVIQFLRNFSAKKFREISFCKKKFLRQNSSSRRSETPFRKVTLALLERDTL